MEEIIRNKQINRIVEVRGWEFVEHYDTLLIFNDKGDEIKVKIRAHGLPCVWRNDVLQSDILHDVFKFD